jgi:fimbrial isopeptide formation D2 family protein
MVKEWKKGSWLWGLAAGAGLALVMAAIVLSSSGPGTASVANAADPPTATPTATPTTVPVCDLEITKDVDDSTVPEDGTATYTITVKNNGDDCDERIKISDEIPSHTECADATVDSSSDIDDSDVSIADCDSDTDTITWRTDSGVSLDSDDELIVNLSLDLTSGANEDDKITNEACITEPANLKCDSARITVGGATATPTTGPTATAGPTVTVPTVRPVTQPPVVAVQPTLSPPITGTGGSDSGSPLVLGLGLIGGLLVVGSGVVLAKRTR